MSTVAAILKHKGYHVSTVEPAALVPDQLKSGVSHGCRYEPEAQRTSRSKESVKAWALCRAYKMRPRAFRRSFASPYCLHQAKIASMTGRNSVALSVIA